MGEDQGDLPSEADSSASDTIEESAMQSLVKRFDTELHGEASRRQEAPDPGILSGPLFVDDVFPETEFRVANKQGRKEKAPKVEKAGHRPESRPYCFTIISYAMSKTTDPQPPYGRGQVRPIRPKGTASDGEQRLQAQGWHG